MVRSAPMAGAWSIAVLSVFSVTSLAILDPLSTPSCAYEGGTLEHAGSLRGRVRFEGARPKPDLIGVTRNEAVCGEHVQDRSLVVGPKGELANVAVHLVGVESGRAIDTEHGQPLDNVNCRFEPHVQTLSIGQALVIRNSDPILHNTHAHVLEGDGNRFNIALPFQGKEVRKTVRKTGVQQVKCDAGHTWMNAYFLVFDHPYHTVTDASGHFEIPDIPPGSYTLRVWHEVLGTHEVQIQIEEGSCTEVPEITLRAPK